MAANTDTRNSDGWLEPAVARILDTIPPHHTVDVRSVTSLLLLLATQGDVKVGKEEANDAVVAACLERRRAVAV